MSHQASEVGAVHIILYIFAKAEAQRAYVTFFIVLKVIYFSSLQENYLQYYFLWAFNKGFLTITSSTFNLSHTSSSNYKICIKFVYLLRLRMSLKVLIVLRILCIMRSVVKIHIYSSFLLSEGYVRAGGRRDVLLYLYLCTWYVCC